MMRQFIAGEAIRLDGKFLTGVSNRESWEAQRPSLHQQYLEMLGLWPLPERTPLNPQVTGVLDRAEGFRVEKLHFQSRPHLYVTGNLYLPKEAKAGSKLPAVLYVCGHSGKGRDGNKTAFQQHGMWFATHGYLCLIIDTLQLGEIAGIHHGTYRYNRWWWQARGYTPAGVECWNGIRAIDYLQSRPEVDSNRIAVTGISGGGAATFWISAADERVKVAVPVSGMGDLEDYVGKDVVNGHCDCMFLINAFHWPWTQIAALIAPRPMLFENSGHDTIFPMDGNDRIRARLERLYGFYTNRTDRLFDIGVMAGGHDDKVELRLMAYRWINRFLKGDDSPVTEPDLPKFEGRELRAFPDELPRDELNSRIDEVFVPEANHMLPATANELTRWRTDKLHELRRLSLADLPTIEMHPQLALGTGNVESGSMVTESHIVVSWKFFPASKSGARGNAAIVILGEDEPLDTKPEWTQRALGDISVLLVAPRGSGPLSWSNPPPFYIRRALALLGRTIDTSRLVDVLAVARAALQDSSARALKWKIAGQGTAGVLAAYAALLEPRFGEVVAVNPPVSHRDGPIFLNVLRVWDTPEAFGALAPRPLTVYSAHQAAFDPTARLYQLGKGRFNLQALP